MQTGPGIEIAMRNKMMESDILVSNQMLRSAAATRQAKSGTQFSLRHWTGSVLRSIGAQLAGFGTGPGIGECSTVTCAS